MKTKILALFLTGMFLLASISAVSAVRTKSVNAETNIRLESCLEDTIKEVRASSYNSPQLDYSCMCDWVNDYKDHGPAKTHFESGTTVYFYGEVSNVNTGDLFSMECVCNGDVLYQDTWNNPISWSGSGCIWNWWTPSRDGTWKVKLYCNDEYVGSGPEFTVGSSNVKPDLTVGNIWSEPSDKNFKQGDDVHIFAEIINDGGTDAGPFNIGVKVDNGNWQRLRAGDGLPAGYYFVLDLSFENGWPDDNCHTFTFYVDIDDEIDEEDDSTSDNQKSSELCPKEVSINHDANKVINQRIKIILSKNSKAINNPSFLQFLERFPMLKDLLGL